MNLDNRITTSKNTLATTVFHIVQVKCYFCMLVYTFMSKLQILYL